MKRMHAFRVAIVTLFALALVTVPAIASAADTSGSSNGMKVSPVRTDLTISPGESKTVTVYLQNVTQGLGNYTAVFNDFEARDETGSPGLLLNGKANPTHGLKQFVSYPQSLTLNPGEQKPVTVTINIPKDAAGGGYYGAIRFVPATQATGKNVSLSGSVASLILVRVPGDIKENMQIASFDVRKNDKPSTFFTTGKNLSVALRVRNLGNIQEEPFGKIVIKKGNSTVGMYEINNTDPKGNVLPDSIRKFSVDLKNVGSFGKYKVEGNFGYGSNGQLLSATTTFYVVPLYIIIPAIVVIALVVFLAIAVPRMLRSYRQRILRQAGRR